MIEPGFESSSILQHRIDRCQLVGVDGVAHPGINALVDLAAQAGEDGCRFAHPLERHMGIDIT